MTLLGLIIAVFLVLIIITLMETSKIEARLQGVSEKEHLPTSSENEINSFLFFGFFIVLLIMYGVLIYKFGGHLHFVNESASEHGESIVNPLMQLNFFIINLVFLIVGGLLFWFIWKYRGSKGHKALFYPSNTRLELTLTSIVSAGLTVIILLGLTAWKKIMIDPPEKPLVIEITGRQFNWIVRYGGLDNKIGKASVFNISSSNPYGIDFTDSAAFDDIVVTDTLCLPAGKEVLFLIRSLDVIHSPYLPHFAVQMNAVPGMITSFHFVSRLTTMQMRAIRQDPNFDYVLLCNKICGAAHYNMQMKVVVVSPDEFADWLARRKTINGNTISPGLAKKLINENIS